MCMLMLIMTERSHPDPAREATTGRSQGAVAPAPALTGWYNGATTGAGGGGLGRREKYQTGAWLLPGRVTDRFDDICQYLL